MGNQLRHGGDLQGLIDSLDYVQGMGIKASWWKSTFDMANKAYRDCTLREVLISICHGAPISTRPWT